MTSVPVTETTTRLQFLRTALDSGALRPVARMMQSLHPAEIAHLLESIPPTERALVWKLVDADDQGEVLVDVNDEVRTGLIEQTGDEELVAAADTMDLDDLADIIGDLPETVTQQLLRSMDKQNRARLETVMAYPEDTAGGLMDPDTIQVRPDVTVEVIQRYLRLRGDIPEGTNGLFVVNRFGEYLGFLYITDLLTGEADAIGAELMDTEIPSIPADAFETEVAKTFEDHDLLTAAVVDNRNRVLGRITVDDVVDVIRDAADHSLLSMAGLDEEEDMFAPVVKSFRRRTLWLGINLATAFIAAWVVGLFQATIDKVVALAVLMPVVASMGGIAGSQTLTLMIRGLALGQVERSNARWLMTREVAVGILNGIGWALVIAVIATLWFKSWQIGTVIALAVTINLLFAALSGVAIPLILKHFSIDPAIAGSVVLTTITDVVGFAAFLGLATLVLT